MDNSTEQMVENTDLPGQVDDLKGLEAPGHSKAVKGDGMAKEVEIRNETAAVEVQRLYRGYRTRRSVADAATMAHRFGWWNVVEGAMLQYNSSQFYAYNKPQNAAQRWLRLKKKAAKVGKGLSKNEKARKLALQHWLEAIDPRHRYGHNLNFYYEEWGNCDTQEPFFYWLDVGEGKDLDLENCNRSKLQKELIRYLGPKERKWYEVVIQDGKLMKRMTGEPVNTPKGDKYIFVMSTTGSLYVAKKEKGKLQHSSFLAGGATTAAGRLLVQDGIIQVLEAHSGHYHPTEENFHQLINILKGSGADLTVAKVNFVSDDMVNHSKSMKSCETPKSGEETCEQDAQKSECNNADRSAQELEALTLEDEQNACSVDKITLMEDTVRREALDTGCVEVEGHDEVLQMKDSFDDENLWNSLEGVRVEVVDVNPGEISKSRDETPKEGEMVVPGQDATANSSGKLPPRMPFSHHRLFGPALQAFSQLEGRPGNSIRDWNGAKSENVAELSPNIKLLLLRRLSLHRPLVAPV